MLVVASCTVVGLAFGIPLLRRSVQPRSGSLSPAMLADGKRISWACPSLGSFSYLEQELSDIPPIGNDECLIEVHAIGLNYADVFMVLGLYEAFNKVLEDNPDVPAVPGFEFSGVVKQAGSDVSAHKVGDRIYGFSRFGAYRTHVVVREPLIKQVPAAWSFAEAASVLVQGLTAWHGLVELGNAREGSRVLVHSAAGGVGCAALEICENIGASAVAVVGSEAKVTIMLPHLQTIGEVLNLY